MAVSYQRSGGPDSVSRQGWTARRFRHDALKPCPPNCDVQGRYPQCPVHVDCVEKPAKRPVAKISISRAEPHLRG